MDWIKSYPLYFLPHHFISRLVYRLTRIETPLAQPVIAWFIKKFQVEMADAEHTDISHYKSFNAFFTRALKTGARFVDTGENVILSPVDGCISQIGDVKAGQVFQAKGHNYSLTELLGSQNRELQQGRFCTIYLSPRDYHRIHMPMAGTLQTQTHIPGRLFSVAPHTVKVVPRLFARNERVVTIFETSAGPMAMVLVGAINVAAIETVWSGLITPPKGRSISRVNYNLGDNTVSLDSADEMGRFNMGSTVILVFTHNAIWLEHLTPGDKIQMGEKIGSFISH